MPLLRGLVPVVALTVTACAASTTPVAHSSTPSGPPPTAALSSRSTPQPSARQSPESPEFDSPRCFTEAKDPTTGQGLTEADCTEATRLALADSRMQQLLAGRTYEVNSVVLWTRGADLFGAVVTLELAEPATVQGEWLGIVNNCTLGASPPYHSVPYRQSGKNLRQVGAWIDLARHQAVGVVPAPDPTYPWSPDGMPELVGDATWPPNTCPGD